MQDKKKTVRLQTICRNPLEEKFQSKLGEALLKAPKRAYMRRFQRPLVEIKK